MSNSPIDELARRRAAATQGETFTYNSLQGATVQVPAGWLALCHYDWQEEARENVAFISFAMNNTTAIVAERDALRERVKTLERDAEIERLRTALTDIEEHTGCVDDCRFGEQAYHQPECTDYVREMAREALKWGVEHDQAR